jgi:hypothetical protein
LFLKVSGEDIALKHRVPALAGGGDEIFNNVRSSLLATMKINHFVFYSEMKRGLNFIGTDNNAHTPPDCDKGMRGTN